MVMAHVPFLDKAAQSHFKRDVGREPTRRMHNWLHAYEVVGIGALRT
jgi:hypothetical protein